MGMPLELNWLIVTKNNEKRINEHDFILEKEGYRLYPLDIPINISKKKTDNPFGLAKIKKVIWESGKTIITYQLIDLKSSN